MPHDARSIANEFIGRALGKTRPLTPMQTIKLAYIAHGWMLGLYGRPLFHQPVEAWRYGPVIDDIYQRLKQYGSSHVDQRVMANPGDELDATEINLIDQVFDKYGHLTGIALSEMTHAPDTPWHTTWNMHGQNEVISNDLIEHHYSGLANAAHANQSA